MDVRTLSRIRGVAKVTGTPVALDDATLVYFLCPCLSSKGITVRKDGMGYSAKYVDRLSISAKERTAKANAFKAAAATVGWKCDPVAIWGSADTLILYDQVDFPALPDKFEGRIVPNHEQVKASLDEFWSYYESEPWKECPVWVVKQEEQRLLSLLPPSCKCLRLEFVRRVFAGFALDGNLLRKGALGIGRNPIILGVESPGVGELQNAALHPFTRIPVIQLK